MYSKIKIAGHPLHVMLVGFPVTFYTATFICFIIHYANADPFWFKVAVIANCAGVVTALLAAIPGFIDWLNIPKIKKAKRTGILHMLLNVSTLTVLSINLYLQYPKWNDAAPDAAPALLLTGLGFILTIMAGFLGWSLVQKHHIGVALTDEQQRIDPFEGVNT